MIKMNNFEIMQRLKFKEVIYSLGEPLLISKK